MGSEKSQVAESTDLTEEDLLARVRDSREQWESISLGDPQASLEWANQLGAVADRLANLYRGRAASIQGGAQYLVGEYQQADRCYYEAAVLLHGHPADEADNFRRMSLICMVRRSFDEAAYLLNRALDLSRQHGSEEQIGKTLLEFGNLHFEMRSYLEAAKAYLVSLGHLDQNRPTCIVAAHNLSSALVMLRRSKEIPEVANTLHRIRKKVSRFSLLKTRMEWLLVITSIQLGASNHAIRRIPKIIAKLEKEALRGEDAGAARIDLAQALWEQGQRDEACSALEDAMAIFADIYGMPPAVIQEISVVIDTLRSVAVSTVEPWDVRRKLATARLRSSDTDLETDEESGPSKDDFLRQSLHRTAIVLPYEVRR